MSSERRNTGSKSGLRTRLVVGAILALGALGVAAGSYFLRVEEHRHRLRFEEQAQLIGNDASSIYREPPHQIEPQLSELNKKVLQLDRKITEAGFQERFWSRSTLGRAYQAVGDETRASQLFWEAAGKGSEEWQLALDLADLMALDPILNEGEPVKSKQYKILLKRIPRNERIHPAGLYEALFMFSEGRFDQVLEATRDLDGTGKSALMLGLTASSYCALGDDKLQAGRYDSALVEYRLSVLIVEKLIREVPSQPKAHLAMARLYFRMYDAEHKDNGLGMANYLDLAMASLQRAESIQPDHPLISELNDQLQERKTASSI